MVPAEGSCAHVMISGKIYRTVTDQCWNPFRRLEDMDREGVERQVLSVMPELFNYWADPADSAFFCSYMNESIANMVLHSPNRFIGLGIVPLQDPELAAKELERVKKDYRLAGVEIGTHVRGRPIGDPIFHVFFETAAKLDLAVFVHPLHPIGEDRIVGPPVLNNLIGFPSETAFSIASVITGLVLERFPNLRICFSHGGGSFGLIFPRLIHGWQTIPELREALPQSPEIYAKKLFFDTLVYDHRVLRYLLGIFSIDQFLVGSDYPFLIRETPPGNILDTMGELSKNQRNALRRENALRFLGQTESRT
jgi:aminocarboxymuconate-semialdehyde decarboxylase